MKKLQIIFIVFIICCISFPLIKFHPNENVSQTENRMLASRPELIKKGVMNKSYFSELDNFFQDHFGGRDKLISISDFLEYKILRKKHVCPKAVEGKNGWYFYILAIDGGNYYDFLKRNILNENQMEVFRKKIQNTTKWCDENGIKYVFVICPNKHSIYPEYYPFERPEGITRADQISEVFFELNIPFVFSRDYLLEKKKMNEIPLYYETDTHWNPLGAYYSFEEIFQKIQEQLPGINFPIIEYEKIVSYSDTDGDILPMLGIKKASSTRVALVPKNSKDSDYFEYIKNEGNSGVKTMGSDIKLPRAIVFRDSFSSSLIQFLSPLFSSAEYNWRIFSETDKEYVLENKPDIIIFEVVERYAPDIIKN